GFCLDCCGCASPIRRANALCTLLRAATSRRHSWSIVLLTRSAGPTWYFGCVRHGPRLTIARDSTLPFRLSGIAGGGGDASPKSKAKSVVSARAGATND